MIGPLTTSRLLNEITEVEVQPDMGAARRIAIARFEEMADRTRWVTETIGRPSPGRGSRHPSAAASERKGDRDR